MKIGILTLHAQPNYGALLQAFALKSFLESRRHYVSVIDRWMGNGKEPVASIFAWYDAFMWLRLLLKCLVQGCGCLFRQVRGFRTQRFIKSHLNITPYHFHFWSEVTFKLPFDSIIVGSDQVWNGLSAENFKPYLFYGYKFSVSNAISYAASFGCNALLEEYQAMMLPGLKKFKKLSCREESGCELLRGMGFNSVRVVDPVLLVDRSVWGGATAKTGVVVYSMEENLVSLMDSLQGECAMRKLKVDVLVDHYYGTVRHLLKKNVSVHLAAGPEEFLNLFRNSEAVVTDSFHGLCFASIFGLNVRFVRPQTDNRRIQFSRIETFAKNYVIGDMFVDSFAEGVADLPRRKIEFRQDVIEAERQRSAQWLINALVKDKETSR